jgi:hypothetical protein
MFALVAGACLIKEKVLGELGLHKLRVVLLIAGVYYVGHGGYYARWRTTQPHQAPSRLDFGYTKRQGYGACRAISGAESEDEGRNGAD